MRYGKAKIVGKKEILKALPDWRREMTEVPLPKVFAEPEKAAFPVKMEGVVVDEKKRSRRGIGQVPDRFLEGTGTGR